jgi:hypothetical protein
VVKQPGREPPHDAPKRVPNDAEPLNLDPAGLQPLELILNLLCDALGADLDAVVRRVARVALRHEHVHILVRSAVAQRGGEELEVRRVAPQPGGRLACRLGRADIGRESAPVDQDKEVGGPGGGGNRRRGHIISVPWIRAV